MASRIWFLIAGGLLSHDALRVSHARHGLLPVAGEVALFNRSWYNRAVLAAGLFLVPRASGFLLSLGLPNVLVTRNLGEAAYGSQLQKTAS